MSTLFSILEWQPWEAQSLPSLGSQGSNCTHGYTATCWVCWGGTDEGHPSQAWPSAWADGKVGGGENLHTAEAVYPNTWKHGRAQCIWRNPKLFQCVGKVGLKRLEAGANNEDPWMSGNNFGLSWRQWKIIVQDSLEYKKGHGHDGSDLPFKRIALAVWEDGVGVVGLGWVCWNVDSILKCALQMSIEN